MRSASHLLVLLCALALAACASAPTQVIDARANGKPVTLAVGQELVVQLDEKPATGYNWDTLQSADKILRPLGQPQFEPLLDPFRVLGSGITTQRFRAIAPGSATLEYVWRRPAALITPEMRKLAFQIVVR